MKKVKKFSLSPLFDISGYKHNKSIVNISIGSCNEICMLFVSEKPELINGSFPQNTTEKKYDYLAVVCSEYSEVQVEINNQKWNYHYIQTIDEENILLVCARSMFYKDKSYDKNARVFNTYGQNVRSFLLGDGIQDLKVTKDNIIWTSYFDEGVFGNYGWEIPIGSCGLRSWYGDGKEKYKYQNSGDHFISDCYAMNVVDNEHIWFYYYTDFELCRYKNGMLDYFKPDISGSDGFAVLDDYLLFRGGYSKHDNYYLYKLNANNSLRLVSELKLVNEEGNEINASLFDYRESVMIFLHESKVYRLDLREVINQL